MLKVHQDVRERISRPPRGSFDRKAWCPSHLSNEKNPRVHSGPRHVAGARPSNSTSLLLVRKKIFVSVLAKNYCLRLTKQSWRHLCLQMLSEKLIPLQYIETAKQILMLLYVLRSIHTNLLLDVLCYDVVRTNSRGLPKLNICLWVFYMLIGPMVAILTLDV